MAKKPAKRTTRKLVQGTQDVPYVPPPDVRVPPDLDTDDAGDDGLTIRQRQFVAALVGPARGNATRAAELAGYASENRPALAATAYENLRKPQIQEAVAHALARKKASPEWARASLIDLASSSMANFVTVDDGGSARIDFAKAAAAGALGQIKEYREEGVKVGDSPMEVVKRTIKIHDRTAALGMLLKLHGLLGGDDDGGADVKAVRVRPVKKPDADG